MSASGAQEGLSALEGKRTGVRYRDLAAILVKAGAREVSRNGSHRTWHHPLLRDHLTLVEHTGEVLVVYIQKTRRYLRLILEADAR